MNSEQRNLKIEGLADRLTGSGDLTNDSLREALFAVPRDLFVPDVSWAHTWNAAGGERIDKAADPAAWFDAVYSDRSIITQTDDGATEAWTGEGADYTSSLSAPGIVVRGLGLLDPYAGQRALDVGTGTGWTAGLLSERVGEKSVVSVEIDPALAKQAAVNLEVAGYAPRLLVGDAATIDLGEELFDLVHVTCGVTRLPYQWVKQCRPGAGIMFPWIPDYGYGYLVRLDVLPDGTAVGKLQHGATYMMLRSQRPVWSPVRAWMDAGGAVDESVTHLDPRTVRYGQPDGAIEAVMSALVPGVQSRLVEDDDSGECTLWLLDAAGPGGSWASVDYEPGKPAYNVQQSGDRRLWDEVETAFFRWLSWGRPGFTRFGLTVALEGQAMWLDRPDRIITPIHGPLTA